MPVAHFREGRAGLSIQQASVGALLRTWRRRRRMSQHELAGDAEISAKHLSFLETGRSRPSLGMLLHLAQCLDIPLRDRNTLLQAAGFQPVFRERHFNEPAFERVRQDVELLLSAHEPNPALAIDRHWTMLTANRAVAHLVAGADPMLLRTPVNLLKLFLHPVGLAPRIVNLAQWRAYLIARVRRQIDATDDPGLADLLEEIRSYPAPRGSAARDDCNPDLVAVPLRLATIGGELSFLVMTSLFGTPTDITLAELNIESFLPGDRGTADIMRQHMQPGRTASNDETGAALAG